MKTLKDVVIDRCRSGLERQQIDGSMLAGTNGAYGDVDTPVRNTSHWLYLFCFAYKATQDEEFRAGAEAALEYILACRNACVGGIVMRHAPRKDATNGILGPAHVVEALLQASAVLGRAEVRELAINYLERHSYNKELNCWNSLAPAGEILPPDLTFNHQLYFAAVAAQCAAGSPMIKESVECFLDGMRHSLGVRPNGRIQHMLQVPSGKAVSWKASLRKLVRRESGNDDENRERRYHLYNLYAFALMQMNGYAVAKQLGEKWLRIVTYTESTAYRQFVEHVEERTSSLGSGTETISLDYALYRTVLCGDSPGLFADRITRFLARTSAPSGSCTLFSPDPETQRARCYRYIRFLESAIA